MTVKANRRVLVIDDNRAIHEDFKKILADRTRADAIDATAAALFGATETSQPPACPRFELDFASQGQEGHALVQEAVKKDARYALAFVDMRMPPGWDGVQTIEKLWEVDPDLQIVICTAYSDYSWEDILKKFGSADRFLILKKPFDTAEVCQLACALTEKWHLAKCAHLKLNQLRCMVEEQTRNLQTEIVERRRSEQALRASEDRYALVAAAANDGLWDWDLAQDTIYFSPRWKSMFGYEDNEIGSSPDDWFSRVEPEDVAPLKTELKAHLNAEADNLRCEYRIRHKDGKPRWMLCRGLAVRDESGKAVRIAGSQTDITDRKLAEEQLRKDAWHDALTGLANRAMLANSLERCMMRTKRDESTFAVFFFDLDRFKLINDSLGHLVGDQLLIAIAKRLTTCVRDLDMVARVQSEHVVRLGGDEFVVLLEDIKNAANAVRVAERIQSAFTEPFVLEKHTVFASGSIGIALSNPSYNCLQDILRDADTALYQAKAAGKGGYAIFDGEMHKSAVARLLTENELRGALERREMFLQYQPIISLRDGQVIELEALIRWQHPRRGLVPPGDFIEIAEETGLIVPVGNWILREACTRLATVQSEYPAASSLSIAVNVSSKQFANANFVGEIEKILRETGVQSHRLHLEITESGAMVSNETISKIVDRLVELNLQLHLDDFGTGYSSLSHLHRIPVNTLKIDRSFISGMGNDPACRSIVLAIVTLAHALKMKVIAEGVETPQQQAFLQSINCDYAQGFLFSRPLNPDQIVNFLQQTRQPLAAGA
jgi:diguanylate cyclase (GGDEF)-like protein/PAS domain S-box-containing protein